MLKKNNHFKYINIPSEMIDNILARNSFLSQHIDKNKTIKVRLMNDLFQCLFHSIICFQRTSEEINSIWNSTWLFCKKLNAKTMSKLNLDQIQAMGLNEEEARLIRSISNDIINKKLNLKKLSSCSDETILEKLSKYKSLNNWIIKTWLIFGCFHNDIFIEEDDDIIESLKYCLGIDIITKQKINNIKQSNEEQCTLLCILLWELLNNKRSCKNNEK